MCKKTFLFVANWKMGLTGMQTLAYGADNLSDMVAISEKTGNRVVVCPMFPFIGALCSMTEGTCVDVGGQTCSSFSSGAYTGDVSAHVLAELGCRFCIVGHSERRRYCHETDEDIACKVQLCMLAGIDPILCIGEPDKEDIHAAINVLEKQLRLMKESLLAIRAEKLTTLWIAYEPVWSIGTGNLPDKNYLQKMYGLLKELVACHVPSACEVRYLYGGSLNAENILSVMQINGIDGFLVGGASLDFQKFKDMISLCV